MSTGSAVQTWPQLTRFGGEESRVRAMTRSTAPKRANFAGAGSVVPRCAGVLLGFAALAFGLLLAGPADAQDVKIGILFGVTGQFASFAPPLLDAVKLAV